jgi:uncharacterized protein (TIGR01244 family)
LTSINTAARHREVPLFSSVRTSGKLENDANRQAGKRSAMDIRQISEGYSVAPQLEPGDMSRLAEEGVTTVICNRPDSEIPPPLQAATMQEAAERAGLAFVFNPVVGGMLTESNVEEQAEAIEASEGPVVAYCASGNRSTIVWALGMAGEMPVDEILARASAGGYDLGWLRPQLEALAAQRSGGGA